MIRLSQLSPGRYAGDGDGIESGPFDATIDVTNLPGGAISTDCVAVSPTEGELHREHTVCCQGSDGRDMLYVAHSESPFVTSTVETSPASGRFVQPDAAVGGQIRDAWLSADVRIEAAA